MSPYGRTVVVAITLGWWPLLRVSSAAITKNNRVARRLLALGLVMPSSWGLGMNDVMMGRSWWGEVVKRFKSYTDGKQFELCEPLLRVLRSLSLTVVALARHDNVMMGVLGWSFSLCSLRSLGKKKEPNKKTQGLIGVRCLCRDSYLRWCCNSSIACCFFKRASKESNRSMDRVGR